MNTYSYLRPRVIGRANVSEPIDPRIRIPLMGEPEAEMRLTVPQALELATMLTTAVSEFCQRRDVTDALRRTEPLVVR